MSFLLRCSRKAFFVGAIALVSLVGFWLRWYLLVDQVLIDDEWHGFYYVIGKSPAWLLTHFSIPGATSIPLNFYTWALGAGLGWSEFMIRLPLLVCGVLLVMAGPILVRELVGERRALLLGCLLAVSPLLIFYSRIGRPYSAVALLALVAILSAARWRQTNDLWWVVTYVVTGVLAVYFHLFALVAVAAPLLVGVLSCIWNGRVGRLRTGVSGPPLRHWLRVALVMALLLILLVLPALVASLQSTFFTVALTGNFRWESLPRVAQLISGTGQPVLMVGFWVAFVVGAVDLFRRHPWFGGMLVSLFPLHALALVVSRPDSAQSAVVLVRYCIPLVPVSLLFVACGLQTLLEVLATRVSLRPALQTVLALAGVTALALTGPLPQVYAPPNNFTSHGGYQHRYDYLDWRSSFYSDFTPDSFTLVTTIRVGEVAPFYRQLAEQRGTRPIVEYPMMIGDHFNPLYYYQHFHRRPVLVGYTTNMTLAQGLASGNIYGNTYIDQVMSLIREPSSVRFRNLVSMDDLGMMRDRGVEYIILHKRFEAQLSLVTLPPPRLEDLWREYQRVLGPPVYEDACVAVFRL